jgi:hypothetical protein
LSFLTKLPAELRDHLHGPLSAVLSIAARIKLAAALLTGM